MNLTREQELFLIGVGIQALSSLSTEGKSRNKGKNPWNKGIKTGPRKKKGHVWTKAQRNNFSKTMQKKWRDKKNISK